MAAPGPAPGGAASGPDAQLSYPDWLRRFQPAPAALPGAVLAASSPPDRAARLRARRRREEEELLLLSALG